MQASKNPLTQTEHEIDLLIHRALFQIFRSDLNGIFRLLNELKNLYGTQGKERFAEQLRSFKKFAELINQYAVSALIDQFLLSNKTRVASPIEEFVVAYLHLDQASDPEIMVQAMKWIELSHRMKELMVAFTFNSSLSEESEEIFSSELQLLLQMLGISFDNSTTNEVRIRCYQILRALPQTDYSELLEIIQALYLAETWNIHQELDVVVFLSLQLNAQYDFWLNKYPTIRALCSNIFKTFILQQSENNLLFPNIMLARLLMHLNDKEIDTLLADPAQNRRKIFSALKNVSWFPYRFMHYGQMTEKKESLMNMLAMLTIEEKVATSKQLFLLATLHNDARALFQLRKFVNVDTILRLNTYGSRLLKSHLEANVIGQDVLSPTLKRLKIASIDIQNAGSSHDRLILKTYFNEDALAHCSTQLASLLRDRTSEAIQRHTVTMKSKYEAAGKASTLHQAMLLEELASLQIGFRDFILLLNEKRRSSSLCTTITLSYICLFLSLGATAFAIYTATQCGPRVCYDETDDLIDCDTNLLNSTHTKILSYPTSKWCAIRVPESKYVIYSYATDNDHKMVHDDATNSGSPVFYIFLGFAILTEVLAALALFCASCHPNFKTRAVLGVTNLRKAYESRYKQLSTEYSTFLALLKAAGIQTIFPTLPQFEFTEQAVCNLIAFANNMNDPEKRTELQNNLQAVPPLKWLKFQPQESELAKLSVFKRQPIQSPERPASPALDEGTPLLMSRV